MINVGSRIEKDGRPGTVIGDGDGESAWDLLLDDGTLTFVRVSCVGTTRLKERVETAEELAAGIAALIAVRDRTEHSGLKSRCSRVISILRRDTC